MYKIAHLLPSDTLSFISFLSLLAKSRLSRLIDSVGMWTEILIRACPLERVLTPTNQILNSDSK
jgi:hypothetical protein